MADYSSIRLIPTRILRAAKQGDTAALETIVQYYSGYIDSLCKKVVEAPDGQSHTQVDPYMKRQLEIKLISSILTMKY